MPLAATGRVANQLLNSAGETVHAGSVALASIGTTVWATAAALQDSSAAAASIMQEFFRFDAFKRVDGFAAPLAIVMISLLPF